MSKKPTKAPSEAVVRREIERLDRELAKTMSERAKAAQKLAKARLAAELSPFDEQVEEEQLNRFVELNKGPLPAPAARNLYRGIVSASHSLVKQTRVAYLGPQY